MDASNVEEYIREVLEAFLGRSAHFQAQAFREGFSKVFPVTDLQTFSSDELSMMFGNEEEDWSAESECLGLLCFTRHDTDESCSSERIDQG